MDLEKSFRKVEFLNDELNKRILNKELWKNFEKNRENIKIISKKVYLKKTKLLKNDIKNK